MKTPQYLLYSWKSDLRLFLLSYIITANPSYQSQLCDLIHAIKEKHIFSGAFQQISKIFVFNRQCVCLESKTSNSSQWNTFLFATDVSALKHSKSNQSNQSNELLEAANNLHFHTSNKLFWPIWNWFLFIRQNACEIDTECTLNYNP